MMGIAGSLAASLFWAVAPLPVALNRLAKEETPLTFFTLLACYCYCRAKQADQLTTRKWYDLSAIGFGLAFASQYIFHLFGLNSLAWHLAGRNGIDNKPLASAGKRFFLVIFLTMAVVNPVMFSPANLTSVLQWLHHDGVRHTGYDFNGALYLNFPSRLFAGVPWYFYIWLVVLKTPIPILLFILLGSVLLLCNRQTLASCFFLSLGVTQFIAISICGAKWMRYSLPLLPFLFLAGGYGVHTAWKYVREKTVPAVLVGMAAMLVIAWPIREFRAWAPYYPLYLNSFGGGTRNIAHYFAPDEVSEFDTRQVAQDVSKTASGGATLATARPMTMTYYLQRFGRTDIQVIPLYDSSYVPHGGDLIVLEPSRRFLETQRYFDFLQPSYMVHRNISVGPVVASTIYIFEESQAVKAPRMPTIVTAERIRLTVQPRGERQRDKGSVFTIKYREYELTRNLEQRAALSALKAQTSR
jgi:hypothetical protein